MQQTVENHVACLHVSRIFCWMVYDARHQREVAKRIRAGMTKREEKENKNDKSNFGPWLSANGEGGNRVSGKC